MVLWLNPSLIEFLQYESIPGEKGPVIRPIVVTTAAIKMKVLNGRFCNQPQLVMRLFLVEHEILRRRVTVGMGAADKYVEGKGGVEGARMVGRL